MRVFSCIAQDAEAHIFHNEMKNAYVNYDRYLLSNNWKNVRHNKLWRNPYCEVCGYCGEGLQCHHHSYPPQPNWTSIGHLKTLCSFCHKYIHDYLWDELQKIRNFKERRVQTLRMTRERMGIDFPHEITKNFISECRTRLNLEKPIKKKR